MGATFHSLWPLAPAAARAAWGDMASKPSLWLLVGVVAGIAVALRAGLAPRRERWTTIRARWVSELRDICFVVLSVGVLVFGSELFRQKSNQGTERLMQSPDFLKNVAEISSRVSIMSVGAGSSLTWDSQARNSQTRCIQVLLPQGFSGGNYRLPFKPAGPSPPTLYDNGQVLRKGVDYTVSDGTIVVTFKPMPKDSLSVWYTTDDPLSAYLF